MNLEEMTLRQVIRAKGFTVQEVADHMGISRQGLYGKLKGETSIKASEYHKLAKLLEMDVKTVFDLRKEL